MPAPDSGGIPSFAPRFPLKRAVPALPLSNWKDSTHMKTFRSFIPPLAAMLMTATGGASARGVLIDKSEIRFGARQQGKNVEGRFRKWKANVDFRPGDLPGSSAGFEIDLASMDLPSEDSESEICGPFWFDIAKFPMAKFASSELRDLRGDRYEIAGTLALNGIAKDVVVPVKLKKDAAGNSVAEGDITVRRSEYSVGDRMCADLDAIANEVTLHVRMVLPPFN